MSTVKIYTINCDRSGDHAPDCDGWIGQELSLVVVRRIAKQAGWVRAGQRDFHPACAPEIAGVSDV